MFKKIILSFMICISMLCNPLIASADTGIQFFNNIDSLEVAHVWVDGLYVRALPNTDSKIIDVLNAGQQVEVVAKYPGWAKVCLAIDSYGFVCDEFIEYRNYAATAPILYAEPVYEEYIEPEYEVTPEETYDAITQTGEDYSYEQVSDYIDYYEEPVYEEEDYFYEETPVIEQSYEEEYEDYSNDYIEEDYEDYEDYEEYEQEEEEVTYSETTSSGDGSYIVDYAKQYVGNPYVYGGNSLTNGVDCSGFTQQVFGDNGISLARTAADQSQGGQNVSMDDLQAGDLLFYDNGGYVGHVAIYCGDGTVVHASNEETGITISDANYRTPVSAKRYW